MNRFSCFRKLLHVHGGLGCTTPTLDTFSRSGRHRRPFRGKSMYALLPSPGLLPAVTIWPLGGGYLSTQWRLYGHLPRRDKNMASLSTYFRRRSNGSERSKRKSARRVRIPIFTLENRVGYPLLLHFEFFYLGKPVSDAPGVSAPLTMNYCRRTD